MAVSYTHLDVYKRQTNNKGITVDTGISLDNTPYLLLLALALVGGVLLLLRRRNREKD